MEELESVNASTSLQHRQHGSQNNISLPPPPFDLSHSLMYSSLLSHRSDSKTASDTLTHDEAQVLPQPDLSLTHAITDIVFVCSLDNVPPGYFVVSWYIK